MKRALRTSDLTLHSARYRSPRLLSCHHLLLTHILQVYWDPWGLPSVFWPGNVNDNASSFGFVRQVSTLDVIAGL